MEEDKRVEFRSKALCFGTMLCVCFKKTTVCNRDIVVNIRDPYDRSLISLLIAFKHVNYIQIAEKDARKALILHVNGYCARRIRKMFSSEVSGIIHGRFDPESEKWNMKFVIIDCTECDSTRFEALKQVLSSAADRKASIEKQNGKVASATFLCCTSDAQFSSLLNSLDFTGRDRFGGFKQTNSCMNSESKFNSCFATPPSSSKSPDNQFTVEGETEYFLQVLKGRLEDRHNVAVFTDGLAQEACFEDSSGQIKNPSSYSISTGDANNTSSMQTDYPFSDKAGFSCVTLKRWHDPDVAVFSKKMKQQFSLRPITSSVTSSLRSFPPQSLNQSQETIRVVPIVQVAHSNQQWSFRENLLRPSFVSKAIGSVSNSPPIVSSPNLAHPFIKTLSIVSAPAQPRGVVSVGQNLVSVNKVLSFPKFAHPNSATASRKKASSNTLMKQPSKSAVVQKPSSPPVQQAEMLSSYLSKPKVSKKLTCKSTSSSVPSLRQSKEEVIKEREKLRETQDFVMLQYPPGKDSEAIEVLAKDIDGLQPGELLNDNIVCFYLKYIRCQLIPPERRDSLFFFDTFFYSSLTKGVRSAKNRHKQLLENYEAVKRRTRKVDLFSKDYIVIPICEAQHWYVAIITFPRAAIVINKKSKSDNKNEKTQTKADHINLPSLPKGVCRAHIVILDSFVYYNETKCFLVMRSLLKYLECEYNTKRRPAVSDNETFNRIRFEMLCPRRIPQQKNVYDCGIYMLKFLEYFLVNPPKLLTRTDTFLRWYPKFSIKSAREEILCRLKSLCSVEKWEGYMNYRKMDDYYTSLIGDRTSVSPAPLPEPEPLRRVVSENDVSIRKVQRLHRGRRNSSIL